MLAYNNYIPVTAGSAFIPGGTGYPPRLLENGFYSTGYTIVCPENYQLVDLSLSGYPYPTPYPTYTMRHGFWQALEIEESASSKNGHSSFRLDGFEYGSSVYKRLDNYEVVYNRSGTFRVPSSNILPCSVNGSSCFFNITSVMYKFSPTDYLSISETVNLASGGLDSAAYYSVNMDIGTHNIINSAFTEDLRTPTGPVYVTRSFEFSSNYSTGSPYSTPMWSGSSIVTPDTFSQDLSLSYNFYFHTKSSPLHRTSCNKFETAKISQGYKVYGITNGFYLYTTAYGDLYVRP